MGNYFGFILPKLPNEHQSQSQSPCTTEQMVQDILKLFQDLSIIQNKTKESRTFNDIIGIAQSMKCVFDACDTSCANFSYDDKQFYCSMKIRLGEMIEQLEFGKFMLGN